MRRAADHLAGDHERRQAGERQHVGGHRRAGPGGDVGHQLVAAVGAGGHHHDRAGGLPDGHGWPRPSRPRSTPRRRRRRRGARCARRTPPARRGGPPSIHGDVADDDGVDGDAVAGGREVAGERDRLERDLGGRALEVGLDQDEDHSLRHPQLLEQVDDGRRGLRALAEDLHRARRRWGQHAGGPDRTPSARTTGRRSSIGHLLGLEPSRHATGSAARRRPRGSSRPRAAAPGRSPGPRGPRPRRPRPGPSGPSSTVTRRWRR